ncbi:OmpA family protein [Pseudomonas sp. LFM046]|uniref:OmpA family protein n=1 Tax=Pseudomonas sp. LFM046 TaxID=1608357 RepID=UPI0005CFB566|nr:OmpA family protein [Pseudomonas sp. LFM046]
MKRNHALSIGLLCSLGVLGGCASQQQSEQSLEQARQMFQKVKEDQNVLSSAPKDVIRAGESLARAERLSSYWGNDADVAHYAYLSQRYSEIASQHSEQNQNQTQAAKLQLERERLQLALREAKLMSVQQQGKWLEEQMIALAATETDRGLVMTLGDVLFDTGRADLKASANRTVLKLVQFLQLNPRRVVRIEGYTDSSGSKPDNLKLSTDRAQSVADALIDLGIDTKRIQVQGYGEAFPVAENASNRGRAQNRRVEIVFSNEKGELGPAR